MASVRTPDATIASSGVRQEPPTLARFARRSDPGFFADTDFVAQCLGRGLSLPHSTKLIAILAVAA